MTPEEIKVKIEEIDNKLDKLLLRGGNDEKLVDKKRNLQNELRRLETEKPV